MSGRIAITGAGGLIGGILRNALASEREIVALDVRRSRGDDVKRVDMTKLRAAERSLAGAEYVIDLASNPSTAITWDEAFENNMRATLNALEAARRAGARRVVFASSNHVTGMYERDEPYASIVAGKYDVLDPTTIPLISTSQAVRPDGPYAVGKAFGESAGRYYAEEHGLSVVCLRIGTVNAEGTPRHAREFATLLTHRDLVQLVQCSLDASEDVRFGVYYGVSANTWRFWDLADAERELGYRPRDNAETFR